MSIIHESESGWIISHQQFFANIEANNKSYCSHYRQEVAEPVTTLKLRLNPNLFEIISPFKAAKIANEKSVNSLKELSEVATLVQKLSEGLLKLGRSERAFEFETDSNETDSGEAVELKKYRTSQNNILARKVATTFYETVKQIQWPEFFGENNEDYSIISKVGGCAEVGGTEHSFIFPPKSAFYCKNVSEIEKLFMDEKFELVVMDPPWKNKYIRRRKRKQCEAGYQLLEDSEIEKLPIDRITSNNALIVVWCTNAKSHQERLKQEIFKKWGVVYLTTWYWLKVTKSCHPICPFDGEDKKQPFETIILGRRKFSITESTETEHKASIFHDVSSKEQAKKIVISVPSSIHSHKPPLILILRRYFYEEKFNKCCEIFARYLLSGFISVGNEVIKLQHRSLYIEN